MRKTFDAELLELSRELTSMAATARDAIDLVTSSPVSYTHLDVYKRQTLWREKALLLHRIP